MTTPTTFKKQGLLSTGDNAERLTVHRTTVRHWMNSGMLKSVRVTPRFRGVTEANLKAFQSNFIPDAPERRVSSKKKATSTQKPRGAAKKRAKTSSVGKKKPKTKAAKAKSKAS